MGVTRERFSSTLSLFMFSYFGIVQQLLLQRSVFSWLKRFEKRIISAKKRSLAGFFLSKSQDLDIYTHAH